MMNGWREKIQDASFVVFRLFCLAGRVFCPADFSPAVQATRAVAVNETGARCAVRFLPAPHEILLPRPSGESRASARPARGVTF